MWHLLNLKDLIFFNDGMEMKFLEKNEKMRETAKNKLKTGNLGGTEQRLVV